MLASFETRLAILVVDASTVRTRTLLLLSWQYPKSRNVLPGTQIVVCGINNVLCVESDPIPDGVLPTDPLHVCKSFELLLNDDAKK